MITIPKAIQDTFKQFAFRGNENLRGENAIVDFTKEMMAEYIKCKLDPIYFIKTYVKVIHPDRGIVPMELYDYQEDMIRTYHTNKMVAVLTSRQQGKCLIFGTKIRLRNKETCDIIEFSIGEFYEWKKFKQSNITSAMSMLQNRI